MKKDKFKLKFYPDPKALIGKMFHIPKKDIDTELDHIKIGGTNSKKEDIDMSLTDVLKIIEDMQVYGFVDEKKTIHCWKGQKLSEKDWAFFLAHEIGHMSGTQIKGKSRGAILKEEQRADSYGEVVTEVLKILEMEKNNVQKNIS